MTVWSDPLPPPYLKRIKDRIFLTTFDVIPKMIWDILKFPYCESEAASWLYMTKVTLILIVKIKVTQRGST